MNKKTMSVLRKLIVFTAVLGTTTFVFFLLYEYCHLAWMYSTAITFLTIFYHFAMRLFVGEIVTVIFRKREFPEDRLGFHIYNFESVLYQKLKVKQWKMNMITAKPEQFDLKQISPKELLHNVMQAELVHRIIMVLSFVPVLFIIPFGVPLVFILTSVLACLIDSVFVIIQRYNRPRVVKLVKMLERKTRKK